MSRQKFPPPYTKLTRTERTIYDRIWKRVSEYIGIDDIDNFVITNAAQQLNMAAEALQRIKEDNDGLPYQTFENGTRQVSPDYTIFKTMTGEAQKSLERSGCLPKGRKELGVFDDIEDDVTDPIMKFITGSKEVKKAN
jgi:hypothetical protein